MHPSDICRIYATGQPPKCRRNHRFRLKPERAGWYHSPPSLFCRMPVICGRICCFLATYREISLSFAIILLTVRVILGMIGHVGNGGARAAGNQFLIDSSGTVFYSDTPNIFGLPQYLGGPYMVIFVKAGMLQSLPSLRITNFLMRE